MTTTAAAAVSEEGGAERQQKARERGEEEEDEEERTGQSRSMAAPSRTSTTARRAWSAMSRRKFMTEWPGKQQYDVATAAGWGWVYMERWTGGGFEGGGITRGAVSWGSS